ncbi:MAG TPA: beta-L-arabinofuranosidase domain-containing protein, partial [Desulfuromonadaceae bacterium]
MLDKEQRLSLSRMNVGGIWGRRLKDSVNAWTLKMSDDVLLDCFRKRPGVQAFIGEHVGKYVDGAILDNLITDCPELWAKVDRLLRELITHQEEDGYLGTYLPHTRWLRYPGEESCSWDPWVAKYTLLALARYYEMTHDEVFSNCALRLLKLLIEIYGENGKYDLNLSDAQAGLASGSILEAVLKWYEISGKEELLGFAERIVIYYWSEQAPNTPHLLKHMTQLPYGLKTVGHGKAYEMMSCFVGLVEFSRLTGRREYLDKVIVARDHIASQYKQINGCMSEREWFTRAKNFSEMADLENCVAFTWIQLNSRLFEMTGDIRCIDYIEETMWNHICQSICPDASTWIYYTTLIGPKDYSYWSQLPSSPGMTEMMSIHGFSYDYTEEQLTTQYESAPITCCHSNGQRALGLVPQYAVTVTKAGKLSINLLMELKKTLDIDGNTVDIEIKTDFPRSGSAKLVIECERPVEAMVRIPYWTDHAMLNGSACEADAFEP